VTRAAALLFVFVTVVACRPGPAPLRSLDPNADVVVPYSVSGGGEIRFTVHPRYDVGRPITFELDITAGVDRIRGPISGRVLASGLEGERLVRQFAAGDLDPREAFAGQKVHVTVVWDGRDSDGKLVPAETYSLSLDFLIGEQTQRLGSVIEVRAP
jgi:hypothetical protein